MEESAEYNNSLIVQNNKCFERLFTVLRVVECGYQYMWIDGQHELQYVANGLNGETYYECIEAMIDDIKDGAKYNYELKNEIDMAIYLNMKLLIANSLGVQELKYPGVFQLFNAHAEIRFSMHQDSPGIEIDLTQDIPAEKMIDLYKHLHQTILNQLEK